MRIVYVIVIVVALAFATAQAQPPEIKLTPGDSHTNDQFGATVALSGKYLLVGTPGANGGVGAVYVFVQTDTGWEEERRGLYLRASR